MSHAHNKMIEIGDCLLVCVPDMLARIMVPGMAHEATQRGNRRQNAVLDNEKGRKWYTVPGYPVSRGPFGTRHWLGKEGKDVSKRYTDYEEFLQDENWLKIDGRN